MIGKLKGLIDSIFKDHLIIDVGGVGYIVSCSSRTLHILPNIGEAVSLLIETHVREDSISLFGFMDQEEREWFRSLITVKGVGSKLALTILSHLSPSMVASSISIKDKNAFKQISGVGPKLADRIFTELKDKGGNFTSSPKVLNVSNNKTNEIMDDAISALLNLGYNGSESHMVVNNIIQKNQDVTLSELIKLSLKELAK
ncbi:Holliday junction ATP-dependent DNA helicase RuvA [Candidatus Arcanobacter lacustris]|jgi:Holliday junction DNA helicase RuvA|uniref:Holliday junction branch migration complex subunit RuvA n=1 Tax=Candidatus Arcanibacter lacustris TaxID=1607817 RepID=A0A0F5MN34_9RICK|nr:Holliday junction ATP-dependent DNA helicase RuvA [Candidatus Arcanobacter lacustris]